MTPGTIDDPRQGDLFVANPYLIPLPPVSNPIPKPDAVVRPAHYTRFAIEPITFITANNLPFIVGNVVKYICRYDAKNGDEDIRKAIRYCEMLLEHRKREREGTVRDCVGNPL